MRLSTRPIIKLLCKCVYRANNFFYKCENIRKASAKKTTSGSLGIENEGVCTETPTFEHREAELSLQLVTRGYD